MNGKRAARPVRKQNNMLLWILYAVLVALILIYVLHNSAILGVAVVILIVAILFVEFKYSVREEGIRKTVTDVALALAAVAALWIVLIVVLQTSSPIDVVSSCSMLPVLQRGEMVFLHGIPNMTSFLRIHGIPAVNVSNAAFSAFLSNISGEFLAYYPYENGNVGRITTYYYSGEQVGLYNLKCLDINSELGQPGNDGRCYVTQSAQQGNLIKYNYSIGNVSINGTIYQEVYTSSITIANTTIAENYSNPIVIYRTNASDAFTGDIIHRIYAAMRVGGIYYILTKGDNNQVLDLQALNYPPSQSNIVGYYIGGVPYLGYLRLIVSGSFVPDPQCDQVTLRN